MLEAQASLSVHVFCMPKKMPEATEARNRRGDEFHKHPKHNTSYISSYNSIQQATATAGGNMCTTCNLDTEEILGHLEAMPS